MPAIVSATATPQVFTLHGRRTVTMLVKAGRYEWSDPSITDELFPLTEEREFPRTIELDEFDRDPSSDEVLAEFAARGLERPVPADCFDFGIEHPGEQRKHPIVFLHKPVLVHGHPSVLVLRADVGHRGLDLPWFARPWSRHCVFAGVRPATGEANLPAKANK